LGCILAFGRRATWARPFGLVAEHVAWLTRGRSPKVASVRPADRVDETPATPDRRHPARLPQTGTTDDEHTAWDHHTKAAA
jgi:hypothetical protein